MGKTLEELLNELSEADAALLGEDCQALIRAIGLEGFKKLIQEFSGVCGASWYGRIACGFFRRCSSRADLASRFYYCRCGKEGRG